MMLNSETVQKLKGMKLSAMAKHFEQQLSNQNTSGLTFEERFGILVDIEWTARRNNRLKRLIRSATYSVANAAVEDIDYSSDRNLGKSLIERLSSCEYILKCRNVILLGATGSGKTYLSNALGMAASRNFMTVKYIRLPELLTELAIARVKGHIKKF
jgi:DNA replication protein DnaC